MKAMRTMKPQYLLVAALMVVFVVILITHFTNNIAIDRSLKNFETAAHTLDIRKMASNTDPVFSVPLLLGMDIVGVKDTSDLLDQIFSFLGMGNLQVGAKSFFSSLEIRPKMHVYGFLRKSCKVNVTLLYGPDGVRNELEAKINCVKRDGKWYISGVSFA